MELMIDAGGVIRSLYDERLDLRAVGTPAISRACYVEPDDRGRWTADLAPVGGPRLGPFGRRSEALAAEETWLTERWLPTGDGRRA